MREPSAPPQSVPGRERLEPVAQGSGAGAALPVLLLLVCAGLYFVQPLLALAAAGGSLVLLFAYRQPALWLAIAFAAGILPQSLLGDSGSVFVAFSDVMAVVMILVLALYLVSRRIHPTLAALKLPLTLFLSVAALSCVNNWRGADAIVQYGRMVEFTLFTTLIFAAFIRTTAAMERCFILLLIAEFGLGLAAAVGFAAGARSGLYILGMHKNAIGPSLACGVVVGLVYLRAPDVKARWKPYILAAFMLSLIGTILSLSRGAWTAAAVACLLVLALKRDVRGLGIMCALAVPIFAVCWSLLPSDSAQYAGNLSLGGHTMQIRLDHQAQTLTLWREQPLLGGGVGLSKILNPENVYVQALAETGLLGLGTFLFLLGSVYAFIFRLHRLITQQNLWNTPAGRILLCCAGVFTVPTVHGAVDAYWRRGVVFLAWAAAGLCIALFLHLKRQKAVSVPAKESLTHAA